MPKNLYWGNAEVSKPTSRERIIERSEAIKVPKISRDTVNSCLECVEAGPDLLRAVKQHLDVGHHHDSLRGFLSTMGGRSSEGGQSFSFCHNVNIVRRLLQATAAPALVMRSCQ